MQPHDVAVVLDVLTRVARAHGVHETELGRPDPEWPAWYAEHMVQTLAAEGYELVRHAQ